MDLGFRIDETLRRPLYVQIRESVRERIRDGRLKPGDRLPPESEIAKDLGVSLKIVRQALSALVDEGLIYRRPQRGTFVADTSAAASASARVQTFNIGVVSSIAIGGAWMEEVVRGIGSELDAREYHMFVCDSDNDLKREANHIHSLIRKGVDGLIIFPADHLRGQQHECSHLRELQQARMPFVLIDRYVPHLETDYVVFDNYGGAYDGTRYLIDLGHKRIGHLTHPLSTTSTTARLRGYKDALASAGITNGSDLVRYCGHNAMTEEDAVVDLVDNGATALFCGNSFLLMATYNILTRRMGLRIPDDVSIIGFCAPRDLQQIYLPLTIISHPSYEMGRRAAEILLAKVCDADKEVRRIVLGTELTIGESTAAPGSI